MLESVINFILLSFGLLESDFSEPVIEQWHHAEFQVSTNMKVFGDILVLTLFLNFAGTPYMMTVLI